MSEKLEVPPDPVRMVEGLRDTGYRFITAVADVVDNSIAAGASSVHINLDMDYKGAITLEIFDNGEGMDRVGLINAMKYGSAQRPSAASLGKFGLGLKTASTAFCRKLVVISRKTPDAPLLRATWDLDHIGEVGTWQLIVDEPTEKQRSEFERVIGKSSGTLVLWLEVDRLLKRYSNVAGAAAKNALKRNRDDLLSHLGTVYQRFLDPSDSRARHLEMFLNDEKVSPWDPFCDGKSDLIGEQEPEVQLPDGSVARFRVRAFVLPRKEEFSDASDAKAARITNDNQGIYVYREGRLIHGPDWLRMATKEPHFSLMRVDFSFDHRLDEAFQIDIKKSQIILNDALYDHVAEFLRPLRRTAEERYRKGKKEKTADVAKNAHNASNRNISAKESEIVRPSIKSTDVEKNEAQITNKLGTVRVQLKITAPANPAEVHVQPVASIDDGLFWAPCVIQGPHLGVQLNTGHPYYSKVYVPNLTEGVTIQGMDALLWALAVAELNCIDEKTKTLFSELRFEVSKNLRKLVEDMPEPSMDE
jgi:hypothetical protein